jgi:L-ascorbate metabolism protein UlaG (beta-lactamase superfamily)
VLRGGAAVDVAAIAAEADLLLLTQDLDDHCHMPTLRALPRSIPVVANPSAAARIAPLGFQSVTVLDHGQAATVAGGRLTVRAAAGSLVGPPWSARMNAYLLKEAGVSHPASLFYEPHADYVAASVAALGGADCVVAPVRSVLLGAQTPLGELAYPLVQGDANIVGLLKLLNPRVLIPLLNAEIDQTGPLSEVLIERGDLAGLSAKLAAAGLKCRVDMPAPPGESLSVAL